MKITIYNPDDPKRRERFYQAAISDYLNRLQHYAKVELIPGVAIPAQYLHGKSGVVLVRINSQGKLVSSTDLASLLETQAISGNSNIAFLFNNDPIPTATSIAISSLSMEASLASVIILEQIYRAFRINQNHPYHK